MISKKEFKKFVKLYKAKFKKLKTSINKVLKKHKITNNDLVFAGTLVFVLLVVIGIIIQIGLGFPAGDNDLSATKGSVKHSDAQTKDLNSFLILSAEAEKQETADNVVPATIKLPILMYHRIDDKLIPGDPYARGLTVPTAEFDAQLSYLKDEGYQTVGLADLYRAFYENQPLPPKSVIITFDDGYADNYRNAFPALARYGFKGTFFVVTNFLDKNEYYMTEPQIKEMAESGMDIESHTETHPNLASLSKEKLVQELKGSKEKLEALTGNPIYFLAYPYGGYSPLVQAETKAAGYLLAVTVRPGAMQPKNDPLELYRFNIGPNTSIQSFANIVR